MQIITVILLFIIALQLAKISKFMRVMLKNQVNIHAYRCNQDQKDKRDAIY